MPVGKTKKLAVMIAPKRKTSSYKKKKRTMVGPMKNYVANDPFRPWMNCKLSYTQTTVLATGISLFGTEQVFRLNSLYDPDFSGGGHQPYGFDQLNGIYRKYIVSAVLIEVTMFDPATDGLIIGCIVQPSSATYSLTGKDKDAIQELPMSVLKRVPNTGSQKAYFKQYCLMATLEGLNKVQYQANLAEYAALTNASPTLTPYMRLAVTNTTGVDGQQISVTVKLTYYCKLFDRIVQNQS